MHTIGSVGKLRGHSHIEVMLQDVLSSNSKAASAPIVLTRGSCSTALDQLLPYLLSPSRTLQLAGKCAFSILPVLAKAVVASATAVYAYRTHASQAEIMCQNAESMVWSNRIPGSICGMHMPNLPSADVNSHQVCTVNLQGALT